MRQIRPVLRLAAEGNHSRREIARISGTSRRSVDEYLMRAAEAGISWPLAPEMDDADLENLLFRSRGSESTHFPQPDWIQIFLEMRKKGATLKVLHEEYLQAHPDGMKYVRFCELYRRFVRKQRSTLRFSYTAGAVAFVDFAGRTVRIRPSVAEEEFDAQIFVGVLGASGLVYAEAVRSQQIPDWLVCHQHMFAAWGGTPRTIVPDNLKSAVTKASYREPQLNAAYQELATHYGINVVPARPGRPQDKAKAEQAVQMVTRTVLFVLRNENFTTLRNLNVAIGRLVERMNRKEIRRLKVSRQELFEKYECGALRALPATPWEYAEYHHLRVGPDYHIEFGFHSYSVPFALINAQVDVRATQGTVDIYHGGRHVASHARAFGPGRTTIPGHRDPRHQAYLSWDPEEALRQARQIGPSAAGLLKTILDKDAHIDHQRRAGGSLASLVREYPPERVEDACRRAIEMNACGFTVVRNLLRNRREAISATGTNDTGAVVHHSNLRSKEEFTLRIVARGKRQE